MDDIIVRHDDLRALVRDTLTATGSNADEAKIVSDHLVEANLAGHDSHGVGMLPLYMRNRLADKLHANRHAILIRDDGAIGILDGEKGYGQVVARETTDWGIAKAQKTGSAIVALRNAHHIGRIGSYGQQAIDANLIGLFFVNVVFGSPRVAPFGGSDGRLHTNPICIAVPGAQSHAPVLLDFATSKVAVGKVRVAYNSKKKIAPDTLIDAKGRPTTDPAVIYEEPLGAVLPFGEHKGYGLALMCEILAGVLTGGATNHELADANLGLINNMFAVIVDPARFTETNLFHRQIAAVIEHVTASPPASPDQPVMVAGDPERKSRATRLAQGIPVDPTTWNEIQATARSVGAIK
jgi:uncharacterized oxidoreductase